MIELRIFCPYSSRISRRILYSHFFLLARPLRMANALDIAPQGVCRQPIVEAQAEVAAPVRHRSSRTSKKATTLIVRSRKNPRVTRNAAAGSASSRANQKSRKPRPSRTSRLLFGGAPLSIGQCQGTRVRRRCLGHAGSWRSSYCMTCSTLCRMGGPSGSGWRT